MLSSDLAGICFRMRAKIGQAFVQRIERSFGQDFESLVKSDPRRVLVRLLQDIEQYYVMPYRMVLETSKYLSEAHGISMFTLFLSEEGKVDFTNLTPQIGKFIESFYSMVHELGMEAELQKPSKGAYQE